VVHVVAPFTADLQGVAKAGGRDKRRLRPLPLNEGVRGERGAMDERPHRGRRTPRLVKQDAHALLNRVSWLLGSREDFADVHGAGLLVHPDEIGEGATDVDTDAGSVRGARGHRWTVYRAHRAGRKATWRARAFPPRGVVAPQRRTLSDSLGRWGGRRRC